jgi:hypothetical protein
LGHVGVAKAELVRPSGRRSGPRCSIDHWRERRGETRSGLRFRPLRALVSTRHGAHGPKSISHQVCKLLVCDEWVTSVTTNPRFGQCLRRDRLLGFGSLPSPG